MRFSHFFDSRPSGDKSDLEEVLTKQMADGCCKANGSCRFLLQNHTAMHKDTTVKMHTFEKAPCSGGNGGAWGKGGELGLKNSTDGRRTLKETKVGNNPKSQVSKAFLPNGFHMHAKKCPKENKTPRDIIGTLCNQD